MHNHLTMPINNSNNHTDCAHSKYQETFRMTSIHLWPDFLFLFPYIRSCILLVSVIALSSKQAFKGFSKSREFYDDTATGQLIYSTVICNLRGSDQKITVILKFRELHMFVYQTFWIVSLFLIDKMVSSVLVCSPIFYCSTT